MKFSLLINASPYMHQGADSAYQFACALLAQGHELFRVFFYHDGVYNGSDLLIPPQDEQQCSVRWTALNEQHGVDLVVCVAAAQRRGILDAGEALRHGKEHHNIAPGFRLSGLGQLIEAGLEADRLVTFN